MGAMPWPRRSGQGLPQGAEESVGESHGRFLSIKVEMKELSPEVNHYSRNIEMSEWQRLPDAAAKSRLEPCGTSQ
jgi:hypothetical protein